ncbi:MAG: CPBP family intramembrane metalloprotease [Verrucomicrobiota bacterium JB023]|nr:CPBP family intramembrane metalloprotease [Verrucomicrobiota bacterium JB023]
MRRLFANDAFKLLLFAAGTFLLAAALVPLIYNLGKFLGEITEENSINSFIDWIGKEARRADFARFFNRALYLSALILLPFLFLSLKAKRDDRPRRGPWSFALPGRSVAPVRGQALKRGEHPILHFTGGFLLASLLLFLAGYLLLQLGIYEGEEEDQLGKLLRKSLTTGLIVAVIEEWLFRGILLGIFLRSLRPSLAILCLSLLFAALHFMKPPDGLDVTDPESLWAGFEFLGLIASRFLSPLSFFNEFITLLVVGLILGWTRYRTAALWLPIGLHAGWVFALQTFEGITQRTETAAGWKNIMVGENLTQGLFPLAALGLTALLLYVAFRSPTGSSSLEDESDSPSA